MPSHFLTHIKSHWLGNIRNDLLAGMVVALALIPEAIAFSIIAGVDPKVGLYASFCIATVISFVGGRPGMISAATGAMALVMVLLVKEHGLQYLLAATILTGILQIIAGAFKLGSLMRFVSKSVVTGFVNALAILIFMAQLPEFHGAGIQMYGMVALGLGIIYLVPYITKAIPSPLICIIVLTILSIFFNMDLRTVGDMGQLPGSLPIFFLPDIPLTMDTLIIIFPYAVTLATVGLLESMMTATIVDDLTDTPSNKNRECAGQGIANIMAGLFGGMAGCAMIGQSVINVKSGGRGRLSTLSAGVFLMFLLVVLGDWVGRIPMAALVAVMIMVSIGTFSWSSITNMKFHPKGTSLVMVTTVVIVVFTHNLALGVFCGVLLSSLFFARKVSRLMTVESTLSTDKHKRIYKVYGQVFFASADDFVAKFDFKEVVRHVTIDVSNAHFWDLSAVGALDKTVLKFRRDGTVVELVGMNEASATIVDQLSIHDKPGAIDLMAK
jgi:SulP family sulfate permease